MSPSKSKKLSETAPNPSVSKNWLYNYSYLQLGLISLVCRSNRLSEVSGNLLRQKTCEFDGGKLKTTIVVFPGEFWTSLGSGMWSPCHNYLQYQYCTVHTCIPPPFISSNTLNRLVQLEVIMYLFLNNETSRDPKRLSIYSNPPRDCFITRNQHLLPTLCIRLLKIIIHILIHTDQKVQKYKDLWNTIEIGYIEEETALCMSRSCHHPTNSHLSNVQIIPVRIGMRYYIYAY